MIKDRIKLIIGKITGTREIKKRIEELQYARIFHDTIRGGWFDEPGNHYSLGRYAVGYNYYYVVYRALNEMRPKSLLELGLGQSTILIGKYMNHFKQGEHLVIEHNKDWIDFFCKNHEVSANTKICHVALISEKQRYKSGYIPAHYDGSELSGVIGGKKFDFISIDGPKGDLSGKAWNRCDLIPYIPQCLEENFVIVVDDYDRTGEQRMVEEIKRQLKSANIEYKCMTFVGEGDIHIVTSKSLRFLTTV